MGTPHIPKPVKLLLSLLTSETQLFGVICRILEKPYGSIDFISEIIPFTHTDYYNKEMGTGLVRKFISFENLISVESLPEIKLYTNTLEGDFSSSSRARRINIDPGYIALSKLILATTKDFSHRPYLGEGIYADPTLFYRNGTFLPHQWTYPDYAEKATIRILNLIRERYKHQLRETGA